MKTISINMNITKKQMIAISVFMATIIYVFFAIPDHYRSEAKVVIESGKSTTVIPSWIPTQSGSKESYLLMDYVLSSTMFNAIDKEFNLGYEYEYGAVPPHSKLMSLLLSRDALSTYKSMVYYDVNDLSGVISIHYDSSSPELSKKITEFILTESSRFINSISRSISSEEVLYYDKEARLYLLEINNIKRDLDILKVTLDVISLETKNQTINTKIAKLRDRKLELELELKDKMIILSKDSSKIKTLEHQIKSIEELILDEKKKVVNYSKEDMSDEKKYEELLSRLSISKQMWQASMMELKASRAKTSKDLKKFIIIQQPTFSYDPVYPNKLYLLLTIMLTAFLVYMSSILIIETIRDHRI